MRNWNSSELQVSLTFCGGGSDGEDEILEILDAAEARFGRQYLAQILGIPLQVPRWDGHLREVVIVRGCQGMSGARYGRPGRLP